MNKRKHEWGDWHHRVPDFKLVYCGPKMRVKEDVKELPKERTVEASISDAIAVTVVESCIKGSKTPKS